MKISDDFMNVAMPVLMIALIVAVIGILIAIFINVYKDAKRNDMNPLLWVLIVIFVPNLLGLVIYLIVRGSQKKKSACHNCGKMIESEFTICPYCKAEIQAICKSCEKIISPDWKTCPYCSHEVGSHSEKVVTKDRGLRRIIALCISLVAVPILIFALIMGLGFSSYNHPVSTTQFMAFENKINNHYEYSAKKLSGEKSATIHIKEDGVLHIDSTYSVGEGNAVIFVVDRENQVIETFTEGNDAVEFQVNDGDKYFLRISGEDIKDIKAEFNWEVIQQ